MEEALLTAAIFIAPTITLIIAFRLAGRTVAVVPLLWAGFAFLVYFLLLRSQGVIPIPHFMEHLTSNWPGKALAVVGSLLMLYFLPSVGFRAAGVVWAQNRGSLSPVMVTGLIVILVVTTTAMLVGPTPNTSAENLLFQATMPGLDEELLMRRIAAAIVSPGFRQGFDNLRRANRLGVLARCRYFRPSSRVNDSKR